MQPLDIWNSFCGRMNIGKSAVPLFDTDTHLNVATHEVGKQRKLQILRRSAEMECMVIEGAETLVSDWELQEHQFDGLIYLMHYRSQEGHIVPLYIGKTETIGKGKGNLSANIENLSTSKGKFARWGDNYQYHIGDLSSAVLRHRNKKPSAKYIDWAEALFTEHPVPSTKFPKLKRHVYFWTKPWPKSETGPWEEFGPTNLTFLEYLLIGIASSAYPDVVLNREGQNRG
jgi:hypothetical protein